MTVAISPERRASIARWPGECDDFISPDSNVLTWRSVFARFQVRIVALPRGTRHELRILGDAHRGASQSIDNHRRRW